MAAPLDTDAAETAGGDVRAPGAASTLRSHGSRVRQLVDGALAGGELTGPDGTRTPWRLVDPGPGSVRSGEERHGRRPARG